MTKYPQIFPEKSGLPGQEILRYNFRERPNFFMKNISQSISRITQKFLSHDRTPDVS
jgi:hypothetical protein